MQDFNYAPPVIDTAISDKYDPTATYAVGDLVIYEDRLYKCTTAISTAETWTAAHWTETSIDTEIGNVRNAIPEVVNALNDTSTGKALSAAQGKVLKDAADTLDSKITVYDFGTLAPSAIEGAIYTLAQSHIGEYVYAVVNPNSTSGVWKNMKHMGIIYVTASDRILCTFYPPAGAEPVYGRYSGSWTWDQLALNSNIATLNAIMEITHPIMKATSGSAATLKFTFTGNRYTALMLRTDNQNDKLGVYALTFKQNGSKNVVSLVGANTSDITIDNDGSINIVSSAWSSVVLIPTFWTDFS